MGLFSEARGEGTCKKSAGSTCQPREQHPSTTTTTTAPASNYTPISTPLYPLKTDLAHPQHTYPTEKREGPSAARINEAIGYVENTGLDILPNTLRALSTKILTDNPNVTNQALLKQVKQLSK